MSNRHTRPRKILIVCHDLGGAQAIFHVLQKLRQERAYQIKIIAGHFAHKLFSRFRPILTDHDWSEKKVEAFVNDFQPDLLLTSTSWKSSLEQFFRNRARLLKIPSIVVLDFWTCYRMRWQHASYSFDESHDHLCVMDAGTAQALIREGYPQDRLYVTGQPHLEMCSAKKQRLTVKKKNSHVRVLLFSMRLSALGLQDDPLMPIRKICQGIAHWTAAAKKPVLLSIRQHPQEKDDPDFLIKAQKLAPGGVTIRLADKTKPLYNQIQNNDLILGYVTMALFEARCMGKQAIAVKLSEYPSEYSSELEAAIKKAGIQLVPFNARDIAKEIKAKKPGTRANPRTHHHGATAAVIKLCAQLSGLHSNGKVLEQSARKKHHQLRLNRKESAVPFVLPL